MTNPERPVRRRRFRWLRRLGWTLVILLLLVGLFLGGSYWLITTNADRSLSDAIEKTDQLDAGWRWEELEAHRATVADEQNSALRVIAARRLLPGTWPTLTEAQYKLRDNPYLPDAKKPKTLDERVADLLPNGEADEALRRDLRAELEKVAPALAEARRLRDLPDGRYRITVTSDFVSTRLDPVQSARMVALLLCLDGVLLAQDGRFDDALDSGRAALNVARSVGDEPMLICLFVRIACQRLALLSMERTLAQGEPSEPGLRAAQELVQREADAMQPLLLAVMRGERAGAHRCLEAIERGAMTVHGLADGHGSPSFTEEIEDWVGDLNAHRSHGPLLQLLTEYVEIAKLPLDQQAERYAAIDPRTRWVGSVGALLVFDAQKAHQAARRSQALCRCLVTILAVERYRQAQGRWPDKLDDVCPRYLMAVPDDPFGKGSLRYRRLDDGVVIYSLGASGIDGRLDRKKPNAADANLGFRLWDVERRRWKPSEPKAP
jgi:hypothetical protein